MKLARIRKITVAAAIAIAILVIADSHGYPASVGASVSQGPFELGASCAVNTGQSDPAGGGLAQDTIVAQWPGGGHAGHPRR